MGKRSQKRNITSYFASFYCLRYAYFSFRLQFRYIISFPFSLLINGTGGFLFIIMKYDIS